MTWGITPCQKSWMVSSLWQPLPLGICTFQFEGKDPVKNQTANNSLCTKVKCQLPHRTEPHFSRTSTKFTFLVGASRGESGTKMWHGSAPHQDYLRITVEILIQSKLIVFGGFGGPRITCLKMRFAFWAIVSGFMFINQGSKLIKLKLRSLWSLKHVYIFKKKRLSSRMQDIHSWYMPDMFWQQPLFFSHNW